MQVQSYLKFEGRCEEALEFYRKALGAEILMISRFKDIPDPKPPGMVRPETENKVLHSSFRVGETILLATDGECSGKPGFQGISLSITAENEAAADRVFAALSNGGQVLMPIGKTFFSPRFGMLADRFGVPWMVYVQPTA